MSITLTEFDASEYLDSEEAIAEFLSAALESNDPDVFLSAVGHVAKSRGMTEIAQKSGISRASLYKAFAKKSDAKYITILKVLTGLGVRLVVQPQKRGSEQAIPALAKTSARTGKRAAGRSKTRAA